jgi:hypothetical protein
MSTRNLDPHSRPPDKIKDLYKRYQKLKGGALLKDADLLDLQQDHASLVKIGELSKDELEKIFEQFEDGQTPPVSKTAVRPISIYRHEAIPGNTLLVRRISTRLLFSPQFNLATSSCFRLITGRATYRPRTSSTRNSDGVDISSRPSRRL